MNGKPTEVVVAQHVMIYSWILYQYAGQVESRFVLHDTEAKEVPDFYTYYNSRVAGGTKVAAALPDGQRDRREGEPGPGLQHLRLPRHRRRRLGQRRQGVPAGDREDAGLRARVVGVTIAENSYGTPGNTEVEKYLKGSDLLEKKKNLIRPGRDERERHRAADHRRDQAPDRRVADRRGSRAMQLIDQHTKAIMEGCKERARDAGLRFDDETLEYVVTNRDLIRACRPRS